MTTQNQYEFLQGNDVIFLSEEEETLFQLSRTYKVDELIGQISAVIYQQRWSNPEQKILSDGIDYEVLRVNQAGGWRKGKVRLEVVFYPEEPSLDSELETLRQSVNPELPQTEDA